VGIPFGGRPQRARCAPSATGSTCRCSRRARCFAL
jgi:hypothetical protein